MAGEVKIRTGKIGDLIDIYHSAYKDISENIIDATAAGKIRKAQTLAQIKGTLKDLDDDVDSWIRKEIPQYYLDGANQAVQDLKAMGVDITKSANFAVINKEAITALTDDTALAFAEGMTGIYRNAGRIISETQKRQLNFIIAEGTLKGDARKAIANTVASKLEEEGLSVLVDKGGRAWSFETYSDMLVRTKAVEARNQGLANRLLTSGYDLVEVSDHGTECPLCGPWEGEILSLNGETDGYDTVDDAEGEGLFHPNCEHAINVIDPDLAERTTAYDNPFNYDESSAEEEGFEASSGKGPTREITVYHGTGASFTPQDFDMFGNAYYVARDQNIAAEFGKVTTSTLNIKASEILTINSQAELNRLILNSLEAYPHLDPQESIPKYASKLGYKAIEGAKSFDELAGIALFNKSLLK
jgi:hypothetical protein